MLIEMSPSSKSVKGAAIIGARDMCRPALSCEIAWANACAVRFGRRLEDVGCVIESPVLNCMRPS